MYEASKAQVMINYTYILYVSRGINQLLTWPIIGISVLLDLAVKYFLLLWL